MRRNKAAPKANGGVVGKTLELLRCIDEQINCILALQHVGKVAPALKKRLICLNDEHQVNITVTGRAAFGETAEYVRGFYSAFYTLGDLLQHKFSRSGQVNLRPQNSGDNLLMHSVLPVHGLTTRLTVAFGEMRRQ